MKIRAIEQTRKLASLAIRNLTLEHDVRMEFKACQPSALFADARKITRKSTHCTTLCGVAQDLHIDIIILSCQCSIQKMWLGGAN